MKKFLSAVAGIISVICSSNIFAYNETVVVPTFEKAIHYGQLFTVASNWHNIAIGQYSSMLLTIASDSRTTITYTGNGMGDMVLSVYETPTCSASGSVATAVQRNRWIMTNPPASACMARASVYLNPTVTDTGTELDTTLLASKSHANLAVNEFNTIRTHSSSDYLITIKNVTTQGMADGCIRLIIREDDEQ